MVQPVVLASSSPRRRELLTRWGIEHTVAPVDVEEWEPERGDPIAVAQENARRKARACLEAGTVRSGACVLASDTVVALPDDESAPPSASARLLAKPADVAEAERMLRALSGRTHLVVTSLAVGTPATADLDVRAAVARVRFRELSPEEVADYLAGEEWRGKAGGYAIQGDAGAFVDELDGELECVIGLSRVDVHDALGAVGALGASATPEAST